MLEQLSRHSLIDLTLKAKGDLHIDFHHTTEDSAARPRRGDLQGARRPRRHQPLRRVADADGRDAVARGAGRVQPALPGLEGQAAGAQARRHGHRAVQGMVPGLRPDRRAHAARREPLRREQRTTSSSRASRRWRARCARRSRSIRARPMRCPPPRACSGARCSGAAAPRDKAMRIYTIHLPPPYTARAAEPVVIREGFSLLGVPVHGPVGAVPPHVADRRSR